MKNDLLLIMCFMCLIFRRTWSLEHCQARMDLNWSLRLTYLYLLRMGCICVGEGGGYLNNGLFKKNVMTIVSSINNKNTISFAYIFESPNVWHGKLGHVNYDTLRRLFNIKLLPKF